MRIPLSVLLVTPSLVIKVLAVYRNWYGLRSLTFRGLGIRLGPSVAMSARPPFQKTSGTLIVMRLPYGRPRISFPSCLVANVEPVFVVSCIHRIIFRRIIGRIEKRIDCLHCCCYYL